MVDRRTIQINRTAFAGSSSKQVFSDEKLGIQVFQREGVAGSVYEMAFSGMRGKPDYHYRFKSASEAQSYRDKWVNGKRGSYDAKQVRVNQRREALRNAGKHLQVGDVLVASWGYEQTNYDYYQVIRVFGTRSVEIRELAQQASYSGQSMTGECVPVTGKFIGEPMTKRVGVDGSVKVRSWGVWATKKESLLVGGVTVFKPDHYSDYA